MFPTRTCFDTLELICALWQSERFLCLVRGRKQNSTEEADHCICHHISSMKGRPADCVTHVRECARERGWGEGCTVYYHLFFYALLHCGSWPHDGATHLFGQQGPLHTTMFCPWSNTVTLWNFRHTFYWQTLWLKASRPADVWLENTSIALNISNIHNYDEWKHNYN